MKTRLAKLCFGERVTGGDSRNNRTRASWEFGIIIEAWAAVFGFSVSFLNQRNDIITRVVERDNNADIIRSIIKTKFPVCNTKINKRSILNEWVSWRIVQIIITIYHK